MKRLLIILQLVQLVSFSVYSQCSDIIKIPYSDGTYGEYIGCLDDFGASSGKGILKTDNYQKEGEWESGKLNGCLIIIYNSIIPKMNVKIYSC
jgi:hypothetical protein